MPITQQVILEANRSMLGKTNRALLFARVNMDERLDPDAAEEYQEATPSLARLLPHIDNISETEFLSEVREKLTVTSFGEFLDKFQPGFYYRVRPASHSEPYRDREDIEPNGSGENVTDEEPGGSRRAAAYAPRIEFSLTGGAGWKKIPITADHPYIHSLSRLINKRIRQDLSSFRVDVDASLFAFKPRNQRIMMRKMAEDVQAKNDRLMREAKRNPASQDTQHA